MGAVLIQATTVLRIPAIEDSLGPHGEILSQNTNQMSRQLKHSPIRKMTKWLGFHQILFGVVKGG